jgi:hypothetical protein
MPPELLKQLEELRPLLEQSEPMTPVSGPPRRHPCGTPQEREAEKLRELEAEKLRDQALLDKVSK